MYMSCANSTFAKENMIYVFKCEIININLSYILKDKHFINITNTKGVPILIDIFSF